MNHKMTLFSNREKCNKCNTIDCWRSFFSHLYTYLATAEETHSKENANYVIRCRISALGIVGDLLRKVGALELKLVRFDSDIL